ncbi:unnamed protein product [Caenorhabditis angaria]|uniref:C-type lectin domain-containing protein n=1 Tax=Caenorhabditis angaria TaxID=860376 RepID=A0A9P1N5B3_9PELO|nr:unnamed protein product [Caenorhabditis angaria]
MLIFLLISSVFSTLIYKREISFDFLATRTRSIKTFYEFTDFFGPSIQFNYNKYCEIPNARCFFPIFMLNDILVYPLLIDAPNYNCSTFPSCIGFNQSQYQNYTIIFGLSDDNLKIPKCSSSQFSFTRPNGLNWCFNISEYGNFLNHADSESYCTTRNAYLNGFQTFDEQEYFKNVFKIKSSRPWFVHLGAKRGSDNEMIWTNSIVSTNQTLANNINSNDFDESGENLILEIVNGNKTYNGIGSDVIGYYSCGWYAK